MFALLHTANFATRRVNSLGSTSRLLMLVRAALAAHRQRLFLAQLDDRTLADIGLNREEAMAEAGRPIWDIPADASRRWTL